MEQSKPEESGNKNHQQQSEKDQESSVIKRTRVPNQAKDISGNAASALDADDKDYSSPSTSPPRKQLIATLKNRLNQEEDRARMSLAHEIAVNDDFHLTLPTDKPDEDLLDPEEKRKVKFGKEVKKIVHQAFWDCVRDGIESDPPKYEHAFILLEEIKEILMALLPKKVTSIHKKIAEVMDIELFRQQADNEAIDVRSIASFIIDTMAAICAPARDEAVAALRSIEDVVEMFKQMHSVLDVMQIDYANFAIQSVRPHIQQQQFEYERSTFAKLVQNSPDGLKKTRHWILTTYQDVKADLDLLAENLSHTAKVSGAEPTATENDEEKLEKIRKSALSPFSILKTAYTKLLAFDYTKNNFPETLQMDKERFESLKSQFDQLVMVSAVMITSCGVLNNPLASHREFLSQLKDTLLTITSPKTCKAVDTEELLSRIHLQVWKEATGYADGKGPEIQKCVSEEKESILKSQIMALSTKRSHPVYGVLCKRAVEFISTAAELLHQRTSISPPGLPPPSTGLSFVASEITTLSNQYAKLVNLNQMVYGPFYVPILREILGLPSSRGNSESNGSSPDASKGLPAGEAKSKKDSITPEQKSETKTVYKVTGSLADLD